MTDFSAESTSTELDLRERATKMRQRSGAAAAMAIAGASDGEIAQVLGYTSARAAQDAWIDAIAGTANPEVDYKSKQRLASARLEAAMKSLAPKALHAEVTREVNGKKERVANEDHLAYNQQYLRVVDRWIRLQGLDAPQVVRLITPDAQEFEKAVATLAAITQGDQAEEGDIFEEGPDGVYEHVDDSARDDSEA